MDETKAVCEVCGREVSWQGWIRNGPVCGGAIDNEALAECYRLGYERQRVLASPSESAPQPGVGDRDRERIAYRQADMEALVAAETELECIDDVVSGARPPEDFEPARGTLGKVIRALAAGGVPAPSPAPQPTPETRVDLEAVVRRLLPFVETSAELLADEAEPDELEEAHAAIAEARAAIARRAAPTGQQQEAGNARCIQEWHQAGYDAAVEDYNRDGLPGAQRSFWCGKRGHSIFCPQRASGEPPARPPEPAAAPPSAPQEGLRPREIAFQKKAQERAVLAHQPEPKTDTRPRCTAKTRRGFPCPQGQHIDGLCLMHAAGMWHRYVKQQAAAVSDGERLANSLRAVRAIAGRALGAGEFPMRKEPEVEQGHAHTFDAQLLCTICGQCAFDLAEAAPPLPESALLTKAAPQPKDGLERWCSCSYRTHGGGSCDAHADVARSCVWCDAYLCRYCYDIHPCQAEVPYGEPPRVSREHVPPAAVPDTQSHPAAPAPVETREPLTKEKK